MNFAIECFFKFRPFITSNDDSLIVNGRLSYRTDRLLQILARGRPVSPHLTRAERNQKNYARLLSHRLIPALLLGRPSMNSFFRPDVTKRVRRIRPKNIRTVCVPPRFTAAGVVFVDTTNSSVE